MRAHVVGSPLARAVRGVGECFSNPWGEADSLVRRRISLPRNGDAEARESSHT
jgi:hypothetical protein